MVYSTAVVICLVVCLNTVYGDVAMGKEAMDKALDDRLGCRHNDANTHEKLKEMKDKWCVYYRFKNATCPEDEYNLNWCESCLSHIQTCTSDEMLSKAEDEHDRMKDLKSEGRYCELFTESGLKKLFETCSKTKRYYGLCTKWRNYIQIFVNWICLTGKAAVYYNARLHVSDPCSLKASECHERKDATLPGAKELGKHMEKGSECSLGMNSAHCFDWAKCLSEKGGCTKNEADKLIRKENYDGETPSDASCVCGHVVYVALVCLLVCFFLN